MRSLFASMLILSCPAMVSAAPILNPANGHWYDFITQGTTFDQARVNAAGLSHMGLSGHLVTFSDAAEQSFVMTNWGGDGWIGLTDLTIVSPIDGFDYVAVLGTGEFGNTSGQFYPASGNSPDDEPGTQRGEGWQWVTGEPFVFQAWNGGEPNGGFGENAAHSFGRNDLNENNIIAYYVEYEAAAPVPEPTSIALWGIGLLGMGIAAARRRRKQAA